MGWDVGPGEDGDITVRSRKAGYRVAVAPDAICFTNLPTSWLALFRQRLRWNRSVIRHQCRKHVDMAFPWNPNFRLSNLIYQCDIWFFMILRTFAFWVYSIWFVFHLPPHAGFLMLSIYFAYVLLGLIQTITVMYYSNDPARDIAPCLGFALMPMYRLYLKIARTVAYTQELLFRRSYQDPFAPVKVSQATWHW